MTWIVIINFIIIINNCCLPVSNILVFVFVFFLFSIFFHPPIHTRSFHCKYHFFFLFSMCCVCVSVESKNSIHTILDHWVNIDFCNFSKKKNRKFSRHFSYPVLYVSFFLYRLYDMVFFRFVHHIIQSMDIVTKY